MIYPVFITQEMLRTFIGKRCPYCMRVMEKAGRCRPTREHMRPVSRQGPRYGINVIVTCLECNENKGNLTLEGFCYRLAKVRDPRAAHVRAWIDAVLEKLPKEDAEFLVGRTELPGRTKQPAAPGLLPPLTAP